MALTSREYRIVKAAAILGLFQGTLWSVMSLGCIILYYMNLGADVVVSLHMIILKESYVFNQFLSGAIFLIISWINFGCNTIWAVLSFLMLVINENRLVKIAKYWVLIAILIAILDVASFICLNFEYHRCINIVHSKRTKEVSHFGNYFIDEHHHFSHHIHKSIEEICSDSILPLISIAARGYIFWIINVGLIGMMIIKIKNMKSIPQEIQLPNQIELVASPPIFSTSNIMIPAAVSAPIDEELTPPNTQSLEQPPNYHDIYPNIYQNIEECKTKKEVCN